MHEFEKWTSSINDVKTQEIIETRFALVTKFDNALSKRLWVFDWKTEFRIPGRLIFKLVSPKIPQKFTVC